MQKSLKSLLTMCLDKKNIVDISKPYRRLFFLGFKKSSFHFIHKQTCVRWGKLSNNSGTRNLLLNLFVKLEVVILQNKICHPYQFTCSNSVLSSLINYFPKSFQSSLMLGCKPTTSAITKIAFSGIEPKFRVFFIISHESLMYYHPLCFKSFK